MLVVDLVVIIIDNNSDLIECLPTEASLSNYWSCQIYLTMGLLSYLPAIFTVLLEHDLVHKHAGLELLMVEGSSELVVVRLLEHARSARHS